MNPNEPPIEIAKRTRTTFGFWLFGRKTENTYFANCDDRENLTFTTMDNDPYYFGTVIGHELYLRPNSLPRIEFSRRNCLIEVLREEDKVVGEIRIKSLSWVERMRFNKGFYDGLNGDLCL